MGIENHHADVAKTVEQLDPIMQEYPFIYKGMTIEAYHEENIIMVIIGMKYTLAHIRHCGNSAEKTMRSLRVKCNGQYYH